MKSSKNYYTLQLNISTENSEDAKKEADSIRKAQEYIRFCVKLINEFSTKNYKEWSKEEMDSPKLISARERGMKDLVEFKGMKCEEKDVNKYIAFPKSDKKFIKFAKEHQPEWAEEKKAKLVKSK